MRGTSNVRTDYQVGFGAFLWTFRFADGSTRAFMIGEQDSWGPPEKLHRILSDALRDGTARGKRRYEEAVAILHGRQTRDDA